MKLTTENTEGTERATPETDAAVEASSGQWSVVLKETGQRLERERDEWARLCGQYKQERDEAREELSQISEYGTEEINAAVDLRQRLAAALVERDEARALVDRLHVAFEGRCRAAYEWYSTEASDVREAALQFLYPEQFK